MPLYCARTSARVGSATSSCWVVSSRVSVLGSGEVWPCIGGRVFSFWRLVLGAVGSDSIIVPVVTVFFFGGAIIGFLSS
jgi:hypothetical protein